MATQTKPCEYCEQPVTKSATQQSQRKYWTCGTSCANRLRIKLGNVPKNWIENPFRGQQETRPCGHCGEPVTRHLNLKRADKVWFCSTSCKATVDSRRRIEAGTWTKPQKPRTGDTIPCSVCGTEFYRQPAYIAQGRHLCSRACNKAWQARNQTMNTCAYCGKEFPVRPSETFIRTCSRRCFGLAKIKRPLDRMHNGKPAKLDDDGYVYLWEPNHPNKAFKGWVAEHRLVVEARLGRYLLSDEQVDHIDQDKSNNDPSNLQVLTPSDHGKKTISENIQAAALLRIELAAKEAELADIRAKLAALEP